MPIDNLTDRLARMQTAFNEAKEPSGGFELPPDGDYQALVHGFDFLEFSDVAFLKTELQIHNDPEYAGAQASTVHNLEDPDKLGWLKQHLAILGVDVANFDLTEIRPGSQTLTRILDTPVEITIKTSTKTNKDGVPYRNVYVNRSLGEPLTNWPNDADDFKPAQAAATDDPPF